MAVTYEKTFEIEIINELSASVYNRVLNYVLNHELNKNDSPKNRLNDNFRRIGSSKKAVESPTAFLLGGQPGSGKTEFAKKMIEQAGTK